MRHCDCFRSLASNPSFVTSTATMSCTGFTTSACRWSSSMARSSPRAGSPANSWSPHWDRRGEGRALVLAALDCEDAGRIAPQDAVVLGDRDLDPIVTGRAADD